MNAPMAANHLRLVYDQDRPQSPLPPSADIPGRFVKRIQRTRLLKATDSLPSFEDDEFPDWDNRESCSSGRRVTVDTSNDYGRIAEDISKRYYPDNGDMTWPDDYPSKAKAMRKDAGNAFRVEWALLKALTTTLVASLSELEFKIMLFILNRTWAWKKPQEGIPTSHFLNGVFHKGRMVQAPIAKSPSHFNEACKRLEGKGLVRITNAHCTSGSVNVYEINVRKVMAMARQQQQSSRKPDESRTSRFRNQNDRELYRTGR